MVVDVDDGGGGGVAAAAAGVNGGGGDGDGGLSGGRITNVSTGIFLVWVVSSTSISGVRRRR